MAEGTFERIAGEVGRLVEEKNRAYGDSFRKCGAFLALLFPDGIQPAQFRDALALVRIFDKQMRIATRKDYAGESPYRDLSGYGVLGAAADEREAELRAAQEAPRRGRVSRPLDGIAPALAAALLEGSVEVAGRPLTLDEREELERIRAMEREAAIYYDAGEDGQVRPVVLDAAEVERRRRAAARVLGLVRAAVEPLRDSPTFDGGSPELLERLGRVAAALDELDDPAPVAAQG